MGRLVGVVGRDGPGVSRTRVGRLPTTVLVLPRDSGDGTGDGFPPVSQVPDVQVLPQPTRLRITGFVLVVDETTHLGVDTLLSTDTVG